MKGIFIEALQNTVNNPVHLQVLSDTYRANNYKESALVFTKKFVVEFDEALMERCGQDSSSFDHQTVIKDEGLGSESKLKVALQKYTYGIFQLQTLYWSSKQIWTCFEGWSAKLFQFVVFVFLLYTIVLFPK